MVVLAVSSAALAILAIRQRIEIQRFSAARQSQRTEVGAPLAIHDARQRSYVVAQSTPTNGAGVAGRRKAGNSENLAEAMGDSRGAATATRGGSGLARLMENPEFVHALGRQHHAMLDTRFGALFRRLNLGADELTAFKSLLVEKENVALDVVTVNEVLPGGPLLPDVLRASIRAAQARVEQAIHSSLGSERYAVYRDYERSLPQRATVAQLEQRLSYTEAPLSSAQVDAMVRVLVDYAPAAPLEPAPVISMLVRAGVPEAVPILPANAATGRVTEDVIVESRTVLSPVQVEALRELQVEQQAAAKAAELIRQVAPTDIAPGRSNFLLQ